MYSYEERLRAVKLYLTLGKRCKATIHQLGYPTKNSLKAWHKEFESLGDLQAGYARSKPKYSDEQRNVAVEHWANHGRCFAFTLKALGYPSRQKLTAWVRERYPEARKCVSGKAGRATVSLSSKRVAVYELCTRTCSPDNAACEEFFGRLKTEMFYPRDWRLTTIAQFIEELDAYFAGTTKNGSRSPLVISAPSSTVNAWG